MPRKDIFHDIVKEALITEGWTITHDPLYVKFGGIEIFVDLGAEHLLGAEKEGRHIAVEIKSFVGLSVLNEFYRAIGQFLSYHLVLTETDPERVLYLAITEETYLTFFDTPFGRLAIEKFELRLIIFDDVGEVITKWIE